MTEIKNRVVQIKLAQDYAIASFEAMACPCEVLLDTQNLIEAQKAGQMAAEEAWRVEKKFSRYLPNSIVSLINQSKGKRFRVDEETSRLLDLAHQTFEISQGLFDITTGILRRAWTFNGSETDAPTEKLKELLPLIGWGKITWEKPFITVPKGMELDLGGLGKEYAVDNAAKKILDQFRFSVLVNFGGDIAIRGERKSKAPWVIGVEHPEKIREALRILKAKQGGIATSGDSKKFIYLNGKKRGHILDPKTGFPVEDAPQSVTCAAGTCLEAGIYSSLAMLKGKDAETFLKNENIMSWVYR